MNPYEDMLDLPHHVSQNRPHMSMIDRGAQFSPFAALTGYEAVIAESARLTEDSVELADGAVAVLDEVLRDLCSRIVEQPPASFTCFQPDRTKSGGAYVTIRGNLKKYDGVHRQLVLTDGCRIPIDSILSIDTE